jgi:hypothetical protein
MSNAFFALRPILAKNFLTLGSIKILTRILPEPPVPIALPV